MARATHARGRVDRRAVAAAMAVDRRYDAAQHIRQGSAEDKRIDAAVRKGARAAVTAVERRIRRGH